jgi:hypothetical protein
MSAIVSDLSTGINSDLLMLYLLNFVSNNLT